MTRKPTVDAAVGNPAPFEEQHFTPAKLGAMWGFSPAVIRRLAAEEEGVLRLQGAGELAGKRKYTSLRISESTAKRVYERLSNKRLKTTLPRRNPRTVVFLRDRNRGVA